MLPTYNVPTTVVSDDIEASGHAGHAFEPFNETHCDCAETMAGASSETNNAFFAAVRVCLRFDSPLRRRSFEGREAICSVEAIVAAVSVVEFRGLTR